MELGGLPCLCATVMGMKRRNLSNQLPPTLQQRCRRRRTHRLRRTRPRCPRRTHRLRRTRPRRPRRTHRLRRTRPSRPRRLTHFCIIAGPALCLVAHTPVPTTSKRMQPRTSEGYFRSKLTTRSRAGLGSSPRRFAPRSRSATSAMTATAAAAAGRVLILLARALIAGTSSVDRPAASSTLGSARTARSQTSTYVRPH